MQVSAPPIALRDAATRDIPLALPAVARLRVPGPAPVLFAEWVRFGDLAHEVDAWKALAARALEPNVFYEPQFALPAARVFGAQAGAIVIWSDARRHRLLGLFPAREEPRRYGFHLPLLAGWTHAFAPLGTPLVDRHNGAAVVRAFFDFISAGGTPALLRIPFLAADGQVAALLRAEAERRGGRVAAFNAHARALLAPGSDRLGYVDRAVSAKKRKELRRQFRRLEAEAPLRLDHQSGGDAAALGDFLRLESAGWKGRAGTAAGQQPATREFFTQALARLGADQQASIYRLMQGERALAAAVVLRSGSRAWFWKIAYAEDIARASPGVQLSLELTGALLGDASLLETDSCATAGHSMIDKLWSERLAVADWVIAPEASSTRRFAIACALESVRGAVVRGLKGLRARLR